MSWFTDILDRLSGGGQEPSTTNYGTTVAGPMVYREPVDGIGPPQQVQLVPPSNNSQNSYSQGAMRAGTLGAGPIQGYAQAQQMAQQNPLPGLFSMAKSMDDPMQKAMAPQYQNPYLNALLRYL